jgi:hypothetical protein
LLLEDRRVVDRLADLRVSGQALGIVDQLFECER